MSQQQSQSAELDVLRTIQQELKAPKSKYNSFGKFHYRSLEDILEGVKPFLLQHNASLVLTDEVQEIGSVVVLTAKAVFTDANGKQTVVTAHAGVDINKKGMDVAQTFGASSSYARKYALNGLFLIDDTQDADTDAYQQQAGSHASNNQQNNNGQNQQRSNGQNNQRGNSQQNQPNAKPLADRYQDALVAIKNAKNPRTLDTAIETFKGTTFFVGINNACRARADQMGWSQGNPMNGQNTNMHH
ncbi:ERF family protein [Acinetobacter proteolyticus]|uniref:Essential recombination function protein n=1 Tax=Acinetobacter proteolyticus TaxID=1776741 RepID=A0A2N0WBR5_9GAMM|nr:ERF family protein [Acinetobacter proteolyticus]PKF31955.1 Essential recombination function protein [Acinetobacter proteolyticus]